MICPRRSIAPLRNALLEALDFALAQRGADGARLDRRHGAQLGEVAVGPDVGHGAEKFYESARSTTNSSTNDARVSVAVGEELGQVEPFVLFAHALDRALPNVGVDAINASLTRARLDHVRQAG